MPDAVEDGQTFTDALPADIRVWGHLARPGGQQVLIAKAALVATLAAELAPSVGTDALAAATARDAAATYATAAQEVATAMTGVADNLASVATAVKGEYEHVAADAVAQTLGATGGVGDFISHVTIVPASTSPGAVTLIDGDQEMIVFAGGTASVADLKPFGVPLQMYSTHGAWKLTTGANISAIAVGEFT